MTSKRAWKRVLILVAGTTVLLLGIAALVLPGPAVVLIPLGLGILAWEFPSASDRENPRRGFVSQCAMDTGLQKRKPSGLRGLTQHLIEFPIAVLVAISLSFFALVGVLLLAGAFGAFRLLAALIGVRGPLRAPVPPSSTIP